MDKNKIPSGKAFAQEDMILPIVPGAPGAKLGGVRRWLSQKGKLNLGVGEA